MKWVGQQIYDLTSRFRNSVYLEDISSGMYTLQIMYKNKIINKRIIKQ